MFGQLELEEHKSWLVAWIMSVARPLKSLAVWGKNMLTGKEILIHMGAIPIEWKAAG